MRIFVKKYSLIAAFVLCLNMVSCYEYDRERDYDPFSENLDKSFSAMGFYVEGIKYTNEVTEAPGVLGTHYDIFMSWNRWMVDGEAGVFIRTELDPYLYSWKGPFWNDKEGNRIFLGPIIWMFLPLEGVSLGEEVALENSNNAINLTRMSFDETTGWGQKQVTTVPFKRLAVTFTGVSHGIVKGTFTAEVELKNMEQTTALKLENGVFVLRENQRRSSYTLWLEDEYRKEEW
jgi:hypothetical protein